MNFKDFEFKYAVLGAIIGFILLLVVIIFKWTTLLLVFGAALGFVVGLIFDLTKKEEE